MNTKKIFAKNLSYFLEERGAKAELARFCKVEQSTVKFWADGTNFPGSENIDRICEFLQIDVERLFIKKQFTQKECSILQKFNRLNDKGKDSALAMLDVLLMNDDFAKESA